MWGGLFSLSSEEKLGSTGYPRVTHLTRGFGLATARGFQTMLYTFERIV